MNVTLHCPSIHAGFSFVQVVAVVFVHPSSLLHHHVALWLQLLSTLDTDCPYEQANLIALLHTAGVPQDRLFTPALAQEKEAQLIGSHPDCSVQVRV